VINEGGLQSIPKLHFPGGALIGCSAGFVNIAKIKGTHNAMKSGMLAAEAAWEAVHSTSSEDTPSAVNLSAYDRALHESWVHSDLHEVRNIRPSFSTSLGTFGGVIYSAIDSFLFKGRVPWTFKHHPPKGKNPDNTSSFDSVSTEPASKHKPIDYPPFEPPLSTDLLTSVTLTGTNHAEDQPIHLRVVRTRKYIEEITGKNGNMAVGAGVAAVESAAEQEDAEDESSAQKIKQDVQEERGTRERHIHTNVGEYAGLLGRACPAGVYEYVPVEGNSNSEGTWNGHKLVINSQNCIHCKLCDIKVPSQDITWTVPEGGGGPKYTLT
jgi:electron-transferring-flavoprotein dehydrogenase